MGMMQSADWLKLIFLSEREVNSAEHTTHSASFLSGLSTADEVEIYIIYISIYIGYNTLRIK